MALSDTEKERVRYHLGYPGVSNMPMLAFGVPVARQTSFLLEDALNNVMAVSEPRVRMLIAACEKTEAAILAAQCNLAAEQVGDITLRGAEVGATHTDLLEREYGRWARRLADVLSVPLYPYSDKFKAPKGAGARVRSVRVRS